MKAITYDSFMKRTNSTTILRWILKLANFDFRIEHKAGSEMELLDMLSRLPSTLDKLYNWWVQITSRTRENSVVGAQVNSVELTSQVNESQPGVFLKCFTSCSPPK